MVERSRASAEMLEVRGSNPTLGVYFRQNGRMEMDITRKKVTFTPQTEWTNRSGIAKIYSSEMTSSR